jgi:hypothetical protein
MGDCAVLIFSFNQGVGPSFGSKSMPPLVIPEIFIKGKH